MKLKVTDPFRKAELLHLVTKIIKNKWLKWATTCCTTCTHGEYSTVATIQYNLLVLRTFLVQILTKAVAIATDANALKYSYIIIAYSPPIPLHCISYNIICCCIIFAVNIE